MDEQINKVETILQFLLDWSALTSHTSCKNDSKTLGLKSQNV